MIAKNMTLHTDLLPENNDVWVLQIMPNFLYSMIPEPPAPPTTQMPAVRANCPIPNAIDNDDGSETETLFYSPVK